MKRVGLKILFILFLFASCEIEDWDYRNKYVGDYDFEISHHYTTVDEGAYITHHEENSTYSGTVRKSFLHFDRINVDWGSGTVNLEGGNTVEREKTVLVVDDDGNLSLPVEDEGFFHPAYIHGDTIRFTFYTGLGMAHMLYSSYYVYGLKK